jgi:hypothetical protein
MYKLNDEKMFFDMEDGQAIIINSLTGIYYGTSSLASAVLDAVLGGAGKESLIDRLKELPGCPDDIEESLDAFFDDLEGREILLPDDEEGECPAFDNSALEDGFDLSTEEFSEVQDLILADPIHEVDLENDWSPLK